MPPLPLSFTASAKRPPVMTDLAGDTDYMDDYCCLCSRARATGLAGGPEVRVGGRQELRALASLGPGLGHPYSPLVAVTAAEGRRVVLSRFPAVQCSHDSDLALTQFGDDDDHDQQGRGRAELPST